MIVERIWAANSLRNFHYLIACAETGEALIVDPLNPTQCLDAARAKGLEIRQVLNTHEHRDHTDGNAGVVAATGARVLAHAGGASVIGGVDRGLARGDVIKVGRTVELEVLDTPGHTRSHVCLLAAWRRAPRCSAATRCSMPARAIATTAVIPDCCMRRS
jgi:hydroxyacylglutathione hydrolase